MGLFDVFKAKKSPRAVSIEGKTPYQIATDVQRLIDKKQAQDALAMAEQGVYLFPRSDAILSAYRFLKRETLAAEITELRHKAEREPNPLVFARLADLYKDLGDYDKAVDYCKRGIEPQNDDGTCWRILGKIRLERFKEDFLPRDALLAIEYLERSFELNRTSYKTILELAELYCDVGAKRFALKRAEAVLEFAPDDERALALVRKAQSLPDVRGTLEDDVQAYAEKQRRAAQRRGRKPGETHSPSARLAKNPVQLRERLGSLRSLDGFLAAVATDAQGVVIASYTARELDEGAVAEAVKLAFEAAEACSYRMDIGHFRKGLFEGPSGYVYLLVFDEVHIAVLCEASTKIDRLEEAVTRLVEHELYL